MIYFFTPCKSFHLLTVECHTFIFERNLYVGHIFVIVFCAVFYLSLLFSSSEFCSVDPFFLAPFSVIIWYLRPYRVKQNIETKKKKKGYQFQELNSVNNYTEVTGDIEGTFISFLAFPSSWIFVGIIICLIFTLLFLKELPMFQNITVEHNRVPNNDLDIILYWFHYSRLFLLCHSFHFWVLYFDSFLSWLVNLLGHCFSGRLRESLHV